MAGIWSWVLTYGILDWFEQRQIKLGDMLRPQILQGGDGSLQVLAQLADRHTPTCFRPKCQPFQAALIHFDRSCVILTGDVQVNHPDLQDGTIQVALRAGFIVPPGGFERFMGFEITPGVEQFHALQWLWSGVARDNWRFRVHSNWTYRVKLYHCCPCIVRTEKFLIPRKTTYSRHLCRYKDSPDGFWYNSLGMIKKFFDHKIWTILSACLAVMMLVFLAAGLGNIHFQPGRPIAQAESETTIQISVEKIAEEIASIPIWKQVVFWALVLLLVIIVASLFPPNGAKRFSSISCATHCLSWPYYIS